MCVSSRAAVLAAPRRLELRKTVRPAPGPGEVRLGVLACGVCGSDLHAWRSDQPVSVGHALGHEICAVVESFGPECEARLAIGERVVVEPLVSCGDCSSCRAGRASICPDLEILGLHRDGGLSDHVIVPEGRLEPLADSSLDDSLATLVEPLAVACHALRRAGSARGERVLVIGAGAVGLCVVGMARALGYEDVATVARYEHQHEVARQLGAVETIDARDFTAEAAHALGLSANAPEVVIETVGGHAPTLELACHAAGPGGRVVVLGVFEDRVEIDPSVTLAKELALVWSNCYGRDADPTDFQTALGELRSNAERWSPLITHRLSLDDVEQAFDLAGDKRSGAIKVVVSP